jgi:hypothetical protein
MLRRDQLLSFVQRIGDRRDEQQKPDRVGETIPLVIFH